MSAERDKNFELQGAPMLLAIIRAARALGDRDLERTAKAILRDEHGIEVTFRRKREEVESARNTKPPADPRAQQSVATVADPLARRWLQRVLAGAHAEGVIDPTGTKPEAAEGERSRK